jgi:tetratricopeptide (TPR) repeat protein
MCHRIVERLRMSAHWKSLMLLGALASGALAPAARAQGQTAATPPPAKATSIKTSAPKELVPWEEKATFANVLAKAKKQKSLVFVDVYATWCGPCKMMDRQTYTDAGVAKAAASYVNWKLDGEKGEGPTIARRYKVDAFPTLLILDGEGNEKNRQVGFMPPDRFARFLDDTRTGRGTIDGLQAMIAKGEDTADNRLALAQKLAERGQLAEAAVEFDKGLAHEPTDASGRAAEAVVGLAQRAVQSRNFEAANGPVQSWLERVPATHPRTADVLLQQANLLANQGKNAETVDALERVLELRPADVSVLTSFARFCARTNQALDEALANANRAVELSGGDAQALDALAEVHGARGDWNLAVETAEKAVAAKPNDGYLRGQLERYQEQAVAAVKK